MREPRDERFQVVNRGDVMEYYKDGQLVKTEPIGERPGAHSQTVRAVTDLSKPDKPRVWVTDEQLIADPGRYSDVKPIPTKIDTKRLAMAQAALGGPQVKDSLWNLITQINTEATPAKGLATGAVRAMVAEKIPRLASYTDPLAAKYTDQIRGFASSIAKAFGEAGMLTNQDIERAIGLFPRIGESSQTTLDKLVNVKRVMGSDPASMFQNIFGREPKQDVNASELPAVPGAPSEPAAPAGGDEWIEIAPGVRKKVRR